MSEVALTFVTDFADQAVILPVLLAVGIVLSLQRRWIVLLAWLCSAGAVLAAVLVLKVACYTCGWLIPALDPNAAALRSPSGHAASAAVIVAGIAALQARQSRNARLWIALASAGLAGGLVGFTRIALGAHSISEVTVALLLGIVGAMAFVTLAGAQMRAKPGGPVLLCAALIAALMHGRHMPAEAVIQSRGVAMLRSLVPACDPEARPSLSAELIR